MAKIENKLRVSFDLCPVQRLVISYKSNQNGPIIICHLSSALARMVIIEPGLHCIFNVQPGLVQSAIIRLCESGVLGQLAAPEEVARYNEYSRTYICKGLSIYYVIRDRREGSYQFITI